MCKKDSHAGSANDIIYALKLRLVVKITLGAYNFKTTCVPETIFVLLLFFTIHDSDVNIFSCVLQLHGFDLSHFEYQQ